MKEIDWKAFPDFVKERGNERYSYLNVKNCVLASFIKSQIDEEFDSFDGSRIYYTGKKSGKASAEANYYDTLACESNERTYKDLYRLIQIHGTYEETHNEAII